MQYRPAKFYYITLKFNDEYHRMIKIEQGFDGSIYIKWNLFLAKNKDGQYNNRSYKSYHIKHDPNKGGYRVHTRGCGGNRIDRSISYNKKFITEYSCFFEFNFDLPYDTVCVEKADGCDIVFNAMDYKKSTISFHSMKRADLLNGEYDNAETRKLIFNGFDLIVLFMNKTKQKG